jgi:hypothetical protein
MDILSSMLQTISQPFQPFIRILNPPKYSLPQPYRPPQYQPPITQPQNAPQPRQQTPMEELILLNPMFRTLNLSPEQVQIHLAIERKNKQKELEKINGIRSAEIERETKKQRLQMMASAMESQYLEEQARKQQYEQELISLGLKYATYETPVRFA